MKSWIILIFLAVLLTAAATVAVPFLSNNSSVKGPSFAAPPAADGPAPSLTIEEPLTYQFGIMAQLTEGKHPWVFKNTGAGVLEVRGVSASCSCTTSDLFDEKNTKEGRMIKILPGESKEVFLKWNSKTFHDHYRQQVIVATNDPQKPEVILVVEGNIQPAISTLPPDVSINFAAVSNDGPMTRRFALFSADRPDLKITRLLCSNPTLIGVESRAMTADEAAQSHIQKGYLIEVTLKSSPKLGSFDEEILIETDHPLRSELRVPVKGKITGSITVLPERVTVQGATSSDGGTEVLTLWARGLTSVNFVVEKKPIGLEVTIEPGPRLAGLKGSRYKMTVKLVPGLEPGQITDEIVLKTDDPKASEVRVPVDILVQGSK
jgi:hypothetical protein